MIMMGGYQLPVRTIREMITGSIDVIIQVARLRDGSRKVTHITEVLGMEGDVVTLQNLIVYEITGEDANGRILGRHRSTGIARPRFWERAAVLRRGRPRSPRRWRPPRFSTRTAIRSETAMLRRTLCSFAAAMLGRARRRRAGLRRSCYPYFSGDRRRANRGVKGLTSSRRVARR